MLPDVRPREALILGLGGGTLVHLLARRFPGVHVTGVENDAAVLHLGRSAFGLDGPDLSVVEGDAFEFVVSATGPYEYIAVDLWSAGAIPRAVFQKPFLRRVKDLLAPGGTSAINFFKDRQAPSRLRRLEAIFPRVEVRQSRENYVAVCRPR